MMNETGAETDGVDESDIVSFDLQPDQLYDIKQEAEAVDAVALAARIEIERRNAVVHDSYIPKFCDHELLDIGMMLVSARQYRQQRGEMDRVDMIESVSSTFLDGFDFDEVNDGR